MNIAQDREANNEQVYDYKVETLIDPEKKSREYVGIFNSEIRLHLK